MDESTKQNLLKQFTEYLETERVNNKIPPQTDLFSLFTELAALRNEVKLESRQVKNSLELFKETFATMQDSHKQISNELERCRESQTAQHRETTRAILLAFLEIYDRIKAGMMVLDTYETPTWQYFRKQEINLIQGLQEGQSMVLRRFEQLLKEYQVYPIKALGQPLNPHHMRAIEISHQPNIENGIVTEELRTGFMLENNVLRPSEVKVNKIVND
ncbi:nucleotide exchange factor GrpE [Candidatus Halobeggiatoa sp. HSG11]|nr:nucleotide exchange factor GrpE [Candidatus Halobeggiatoa sp. HSG11]